MKASLTAVSLAALMVLSACGKSSSTGADAKSPTLAGALSPQGVQQAQQSAQQNALPKADAATPLESYGKISSGNQLMFLYYGLSNLPPDYEKIATSYSSDYRQTSDAFKKNDILTALKPRIDEELKSAKSKLYFTYDIPAQGMQHYDFSSKKFPLSAEAMSPGTTWYVSDNSAYQLSFSNGDQFQAVAVADEAKAREIEKILSSYQRLTMRIYGFAQDVDLNQKIVKAQIVKFKLLDAHGNELAAN